MADPLSIASGTFAVVSLAIQLVSATQNCLAFWQSVSTVDGKVKRLQDHLSLLLTIANSVIEVCQEQPNIQCSESVIKALQSCKESSKRLEVLLRNHGQIQNDNVVRRRWASFKTLLKDKIIVEVEAELKGDVTMLLLALQPFYYQAHRRDLEIMPAASARAATLSEQQSEARSSEQNKKHHADSSALRNLSRNHYGRKELIQFCDRRLGFKIDSYSIIERLIRAVDCYVPSRWRTTFRYHRFGILYITTRQQMHFETRSNVRYFRTRLKLLIPFLSFQIQTSSFPWSLTAYPVMPCESQIFILCADGNLELVKHWLSNSWVSPFVVNQHGENLLHCAARYAQADIVIFLLDLGVDGAAYDDNLLTPLEHLTRKIRINFAYPSKVVNTIRALVERSRCQTLLPVTSNAVSPYRGPEEGFAWLFRSEYSHVNLEEVDSEGWTLLGDAAFNFGWATQLCVDDPALGWQTRYLIRAGANLHATSTLGALTPLDAYLRGCTAHDVDHAREFIAVLKHCDVDLHAYARKELEIHSGQHFILSAWNNHLWRWVPTKRRVVYEYGRDSDQLQIWLEDYDALSWFCCGRFDLEIFLVAIPSQSALRWEQICKRDDEAFLSSVPAATSNSRENIERVKKWKWLIESLNLIHRWIGFLMLTLLVNYGFHLYLKVLKL